MNFEQKIKQELKQGINLSIIDLVGYLFEYAQSVSASDIHLDPTEDKMRVRFRVDGILRDISPLPKGICFEIIARIKVLAGLRTDEHQAAQDGRFRIASKKNSSPIDIRVSITPAYYGENAVLRLLSQNEENFDLEKLGLSQVNREKLLSAVRKPHGMILATGPTGSGKTTTLYTLIKLLNTSEVSIITIEDPVEYAITDIRQIQVNPKSGISFANGLRSILRQDPNIIMVGEIRDSETAGIAVNTALTGHLLLSTLHTSDASTTLPRLLDMKIDPYLIASTVNVAIGQRLVRKICAACKQEKKLNDLEKKILEKSLLSLTFENQKNFYFGAGCEQCAGSGYSGRVGIYEVLLVEANIRDAILRKASADEIMGLAKKNGMVPMVYDGLLKVQDGQTTIEEILRVIHE